MKPYKLESECLCSETPCMSRDDLEAAVFFGLRQRHFAQRVLRPSVCVNLYPGEICLITGPSGSGKTLILEAFFSSVGGGSACMAAANPEISSRTLITLLEGTVFDRMSRLYACGIRDAYTMLSTPGRLSAGELFRFELCRAIESGKRLIFCDEFCSCLDGMSTVSLCRHVRRLADEQGYSFVLSSTSAEISRPLMPEIIIHTNAQTQPVIRSLRRKTAADAACDTPNRKTI
jgi:ABC-type ATPase with predicted acetyltransferase domain